MPNYKRTADRVSETTETEGLSGYELLGAAGGFRSFVDGIGDTEEAYYCCTDGTDWEVGLGVIASGSPDTLTRSTILDSSMGIETANGGKITWTAGTKDIFCTSPAFLSQGFVGNEDFIHYEGPRAEGGRAIAAGNEALATGYGSVSLGYESKADGYGALAVGKSSLSEGSGAIALGQNSRAAGEGAVAVGVYAKALAESSSVIGNGQVQSTGSYSHLRGSSGNVSQPGIDCWATTEDSRIYQCVLGAETSDATPKELEINYNSDEFSLQTNEVVACEATLIAYRKNASGGADGDVTARKYEFACMYSAANGSLKLIGSVSSSVIAEDAGAAVWGCVITTDSTTQNLHVTVTGEASADIQWAFKISATSLCVAQSGGGGG